MKTATEIAKTLNSHVTTVSPGLPFTLSAAHSIGDIVSQGDVDIEIVDRVPEGYVKIDKPTDADRQLVPESGQGSHHRLRTLDGVKLYRPTNWGGDGAGLRGPCVMFSKANAIVHEPGHDHPHGTVNIAEPMTILCTYQPNLDAEQRAQRAHD